jgi:hypothetical protein
VGGTNPVAALPDPSPNSGAQSWPAIPYAALAVSRDALNGIRSVVAFVDGVEQCCAAFRQLPFRSNH